MRCIHLFPLFSYLCGLFGGYIHIVDGYQYPSTQKFHCTNDEQCQSFLVNSICMSNNCECPKDKLLSSDATRCLSEVRDIGDPCEDSVQCSKLLSNGGVCDEHHKCSCKSGYHYLKGFCWKDVGLGEECFVNEQCFSSYEHVGFGCVSEGSEPKFCKCRQNYYVRLNSMCRRKRGVGNTCNLDDDCELGTCERMTCMSSSVPKAVGFHHSRSRLIWSDNTDRSKGWYELHGRLVRELGMSCKLRSDCDHIGNAICLDNSVCACEPVLFVASKNNRECLKVARAKIDDISKTSCKKDPQCGVFGSHSYCENEKRCACKNGTYFNTEEKFCWLIKSLNENCSDDRDCHTPVTQAHCAVTKFSEKKCICQDGYHQKGPNCVPNASKVGDPCDSHEECFFPNSVCNASNICVCKEHHYFEKGRCNPGVGTECLEDKDCAHLRNTECKVQNTGVETQQCLCKASHSSSKDHKYCLPGAVNVADHGEACAESFQCEFLLGPFGICNSKICECRKGAHYSKGSCHKSKSVGKPCLKKLECFSGNDTDSVICLKGYCSCNYDYKLDEDEICVRTSSAISTKFGWMSLTSFALFLAVR